MNRLLRHYLARFAKKTYCWSKKFCFAVDEPKLILGYGKLAIPKSSSLLCKNSVCLRPSFSPIVPPFEVKFIE
jgi:hypothetical protein